MFNIELMLKGMGIDPEKLKRDYESFIADYNKTIIHFNGCFTKLAAEHTQFEAAIKTTQNQLLVIQAQNEALTTQLNLIQSILEDSQDGKSSSRNRVSSGSGPN